MSLFHDIEKRIDRQLKKIFAPGEAAAHGKEWIEIQRAILEEIEERAQLLPRARRRLPYNQLTVRIAAVFVDAEALQNEIKTHLHGKDIETASDMQIAVEALDNAPPEIAAKGFHITYATRETPKSVMRAVRFTVLHGDASQSEYEISKNRIHLGRLPEVFDERRRPVRRNDVAFNESAEKPNSTVSRAHAHLEYDPSSGEYRLFDDGSSYGTSVVHQGRLVNVPPAGRGLRVESGDEIYLGQARILFEVV